MHLHITSVIAYCHAYESEEQNCCQLHNHISEKENELYVVETWFSYLEENLMWTFSYVVHFVQK